MKRIDIQPDFVFHPQPMYMIGTKNEDGSPNFCIITWVGFSFDKTPHLMMTIGGSKRTKTNILREKAFSANLITEDNLWLADYFGCTKGETSAKRDIQWEWSRGRAVDVPVPDKCHWVYECQVDRVIELDGSHLFLAEIKNIQIDEEYRDMDRKKIDLAQIRPAIYGPYQYFSVGGKLGKMGQWKENIMENGTQTELRPLSACDGEDIYEMLQEIPADENGYVNGVHGMSYEEYKSWLIREEANAKKTGIEDGWKVPQSTYWLYADGKPVGQGKVRHFLTDALREAGGNIGYAVRPSERGKGYGTILLRKLMLEAANMGICRALVTVHNGNEASVRVALKNGGELEKVNETRHYIWVECRKEEKHDPLLYAE